MKKITKLAVGIVVGAASAWAVINPASALTFGNGDYTFTSLEPAPNGSGLGNYNVILFAGASGGADNTGGGVNVDNSNTLLPSGGTDTSGSLFWMTSVADLRAFYDLQFGQNTINNIVLFLDFNESGNAQNTSITVDALNVYLNSTTLNDNLNPIANDLPSDQQGSIIGQTGGTLLTSLTSAQNLSQIQTGEGIDDWSIFTFINPYLLPADGTLLFNLQLSQLNSGAEVLAISGTFSACDIMPEGCGTTGGTTGTTTTGTTSGSTTGTTSGTTTGTTTGTTGESTGTTSGTTTAEPTTGSTSSSTSGDSTTTTTSTGSTGTDTTGVTTSSSTGASSGSTSQIPEPASFLLLGVGLVALSRVAKRKRD